MLSKRIIEQSADMCGVRGVDVARIPRYAPTTLVMRHEWPESTDARVWDAVRRGMLDYANARSRKLGKCIDVYSRQGSMLFQVQAEV